MHLADLVSFKAYTRYVCGFETCLYVTIGYGLGRRVRFIAIHTRSLKLIKALNNDGLLPDLSSPFLLFCFCYLSEISRLRTF